MVNRRYGNDTVLRVGGEGSEVIGGDPVRARTTHVMSSSAAALDCQKSDAFIERHMQRARILKHLYTLLVHLLLAQNKI